VNTATAVSLHAIYPFQHPLRSVKALKGLHASLIGTVLNESNCKTANGNDIHAVDYTVQFSAVYAQVPINSIGTLKTPLD